MAPMASLVLILDVVFVELDAGHDLACLDLARTDLLRKGLGRLVALLELLLQFQLVFVLTRRERHLRLIKLFKHNRWLHIIVSHLEI